MHPAVLITIATLYLILCLYCFSRALYILVFFIPLQFSGLTTDYGVLSITDMMITELAFVWLLNKSLQHLRVLVSSNCRFIFVWVFLIILSFSNFLNPQTKISVTYFLRLLSSIALFFIIYDHVRDTNQFFKIIKVLIYSCFFVSAYGMLEFFLFKKDLPLLIDGRMNNFKRVETFFYQPNETAAYLVMTIPFVIYFIIKETGKSIKLLYYVIFAVCLCCLTVTFSRAGWLCFTISIFFLPISKSKKVSIIGAITVILLYSGLSANIVARQQSVQHRLYRYRAAVSQVLRKPLIGHGLRTYKRLDEIYPDEWPAEQKGRPPHSIYLAIMVETGIPALLSFLFLIGYTAKRIIVVRNYTRNRLTRDRPTFLLSSCLLASFVSLFLMKFFETGLIKLSMWAMLAIYNLFPVLFSNTAYAKHRYAIYK